MPSLAAVTVTHLLDPLLAVVFPSTCPSCRAPVDHPTRGPLCGRCWETLPRHREAVCRCGFPLPEGLLACGRCRRGLQGFEAGCSLGPYEGSLRILVHELKYRGRRRVAERLAEELLQAPRVRDILAGEVVLVPVPLHPRRRRDRGFNQSELIARALGTRTGAAVCPGALVRRKDTAPQSELSAAERRRNVAGAFAVRQRARVAGRVVVLVDDVWTTGATALACARILREAGAVAVRLLSVARVA
ncbi:MAG TPA: ComF family protein [Vicinamibacteria bacterium]